MDYHWFQSLWFDAVCGYASWWTRCSYWRWSWCVDSFSPGMPELTQDVFSWSRCNGTILCPPSLWDSPQTPVSAVADRDHWRRGTLITRTQRRRYQQSSLCRAYMADGRLLQSLLYGGTSLLTNPTSMPTETHRTIEHCKKQCANSQTNISRLMLRYVSSDFLYAKWLW